MEYYKKADKSMFRYGITLPARIVKEFTFGHVPKPGTSRPVTLFWKNKRKKYQASLMNVKRTSAQVVCQLRWDNNDKLKFKRKTLVMSIILMFISSFFVFTPTTFADNGTYDYVIITCFANLCGCFRC